MPLVPALHHTEWKDPPIDLKATGHITMHTSFGLALKKLAMGPSVHLALEIGTGYGGGSTWCLAQGLRSSISDPSRPDKWLFTVENFEPAVERAVETLHRLPVTCVAGSTVGPEGFLRPDELTAEERSLSFDSGGEYEEEKARAGRGEPVLERLCGAYDFDLVVMDGSAYTRLAEYDIIERGCRPRYLALHDTGTFRTRQVEERLRQGGGRWREIAAGKDMAGWAIYESRVGWWVRESSRDLFYAFSSGPLLLMI